MDLISLILNTVFLTTITILSGFMVSPKGFVSKSIIINIFLWLGIGHCILVLGALSLVRLNIPGNNIIYIFPILFFYALILLKFPILNVNKFELSHNWHFITKKNSYLSLFLIFLFSIIIFYLPFIVKSTSGFYAISGGDISIYLRMAEFFSENGINVKLPDRETMTPLVPNWNILTYIKSMQINGTGVFSNSLTSLPYVSLSLNTVEEGYTISLFICFLCIAGGGGALIGYLFNKGDIYIVASSFGLCLSNLILWMAATHATAAFFVLSVSFTFILLTILGMETKRFAVLQISIIGSAMLLCYLPYFIIGIAIPLGVYCGLKFIFSIINNQTTVSEKLKDNLIIFSNLCLIVILIAILSYDQIDKILSFFSVSSFKGADFGLKNYHSLLAITGAVDFDMLFPHSMSLMKQVSTYIGYPLAILMFLGFLIFMYASNTIGKTLIFAQVIVLFYFSWIKLGGSVTQYAGIRFSQIASVYFAGASVIGIYFLYKNSKSIKINLLAKINLLSVIILSLILTSTIWARVLNLVPHERSAFVDSNDLLMVKKIRDLQLKIKKTEKDSGIIYWFGSGPVIFACNEVLFRTVSYLEAFDFDYLNYMSTLPWAKDVRFDIMSLKYNKKPIYVIPNTWRKEIINDEIGFFSQPTYEIGKNKVFQVENTSGMTVIGDAWNPPIIIDPYTKDWGRFLKGRTGGLSVWSTKKGKLKIELKVTQYGKDTSLHIYKNNKLLNKLIFKSKKDSFILDLKIEKGVNIFKIVPIGKEQSIEWGLISRKETPWFVFEKINIIKFN